MAWEFNFLKNQNPIFANCNNLLFNNNEDCRYNETEEQIDYRVNYINELFNYWKLKFNLN